MPDVPRSLARWGATVRRLAIAVSALAACSSNGPTGPGAGSLKLYVANFSSNSITVYPANATGNVAPIATIAGNLTGLNGPAGVALDGAGRLYVANNNANSITVYTAGATGNASPTVTITGDRTGLSGPGDVALDGAGQLYVSNTGGNSITVYAAGLAGNATPTATIAGDQTGLSGPVGIALDGRSQQHGGQHLFVTNRNNSSITIYPAGLTGNVPPIVTMNFFAPGFVAFDTAVSQLYVLSEQDHSITVYPIGADPVPNPTPTATIAGVNPGLALPAGIALDTLGRIYVTNFANPGGGTGSIIVFPAGATGDFSPIATIVGDKTGLNGASGIALGP